MEESEIEELYKKKVEDAKTKFIEESKNNKDKKTLINNYKLELKKSREEYNSLIKKNVIAKKFPEKRSNTSQKINKLYTAGNWNIKIPVKEKIKLKYSLIKFKLKTKIRDTVYHITPNFIIYFIIIIKLKIKRLKNILNHFFEKAKNGLKSKFNSLKNKIIERSKKNYEKIMALLKKIFEIIKKLTKKIEAIFSKEKNNKKKSDKDEKNENEEKKED